MTETVAEKIPLTIWWEDNFCFFQFFESTNGTIITSMKMALQMYSNNFLFHRPLADFKLGVNMCHNSNGQRLNEWPKQRANYLSYQPLIWFSARIDSSTPQPFVRGKIVTKIIREKYLVADMATYLMFGLFLGLDVTLQTLFT